MSAPVQGTNDACTLSKAAMVHKGYFKDPYVSKFVSSVVTRSPIINRGYFIRAYAVQALVTHLLKKSTCKDDAGNDVPIKQVVSLGAGFDTMFFRLRDSGATEHVVKYVEVDAEAVMDRKKAMIEKEKLLNESEQKLLHLVGGDLSDCDKLFGQLKSLVSPKFGVLFLCEVSLVYLPTEKSDAILTLIAKRFPRSVCVLYEQVNTRDPFGRFMTKHFRKLNCPLGSPETYNTIPKLRQRLKPKFIKVLTADVNHIAVQTLEKQERERVGKLEQFDEFEELTLLNSHYTLSLLVAKDLVIPKVFPKVKKNRCQCCYSQPNLEMFPKVTTSKHLKIQLQLFRHCSALTKTRLFLVGGFGSEFRLQSKEGEGDGKEDSQQGGDKEQPHSRQMLLADMDIKDHAIDAFKRVKYSLWERLNAVMQVCGDHLLIFGGRKSPSVPLNDLIKVTISGGEEGARDGHFGDVEVKFEKQWEGVCCFPNARYRHASAVLTRHYQSMVEHRMLVDGGKDSTKSFSDAFFYDPFTNLWSEVEFISFTSPNQTKEDNKEVVVGSAPDSPPPPPTTPPLPPRHSHSICHYKDASLILSGGIFNNQESDVNSKLYRLNFPTSSLCEVEVIAEGLLPLYGHTSHVYFQQGGGHSNSPSEWLLLVGGVVPVTPYSLVQLFDLEKREMLRVVRVNDALLINHTSHILGHKLYTVGGGGNLFSFGTCFNSRVKIYSVQGILRMQPKKKPEPNTTDTKKGENDVRGEGSGNEDYENVSAQSGEDSDESDQSLDTDADEEALRAAELLRAEIDAKMFGPAQCRTTRRARRNARRQLEALNLAEQDSIDSAVIRDRSLGEHGEVRMAIDGITLDSEGGQEREGGSEGEKERAGSERGADYSFGAKEERLAKGGRVREERLVLKPKHKDDIYVLQISQENDADVENKNAKNEAVVPSSPVLKTAKFVVEKPLKDRRRRKKKAAHKSRSKSPGRSGVGESSESVVGSVQIIDTSGEKSDSNNEGGKNIREKSPQSSKKKKKKKAHRSRTPSPNED